jgi:ABC-type phosphate transport system substrate-binding protein
MDRPNRTTRSIMLLLIVAIPTVCAAAGTVRTSPAAQRPYGIHRPQPRDTGLPTPIFAGGGSVPAVMLRTWGNLYGVTPGQPTVPSKANVEMLFASTNGPAGERYLINQAFDNQTTPSANPIYTDTTNGRDWLFPYPSGTNPGTAPDYVVGSPLSIAQTNQYMSQTFPTRGAAEQQPLVFAGIALPFNLGPSSSLGSRIFKLSRKSYCAIYTGVIIDWSDPQITADNGGSPVVSASTPIDAVYRADSAGTTFIFTTHLNFVCNPAGVPYSQGVGEIFNLPNPIPPGANFVGANGGTAMINDILHPANPAHGAVGYIGAGSVQPFNPSGPPAASVYNAKGFALQPTIAAVQQAFKNGPYTSAPPGYPDRNKTYVPDPKNKAAYPIVGQIYLLFYHCFPNTNVDVPAMQGFFNAALAPQNGMGPTAYDTIAEMNGLAELPDNRKMQVLNKFAKIKLVAPSGKCK